MDIIIFATLLFLFVWCYSYVTESVYTWCEVHSVNTICKIAFAYLWPITFVGLFILFAIILFVLCIIILCFPVLCIIILIDIAYLKITNQWEDTTEQHNKI